MILSRHWTLSSQTDRATWLPVMTPESQRSGSRAHTRCSTGYKWVKKTEGMAGKAGGKRECAGSPKPRGAVLRRKRPLRSAREVLFPHFTQEGAETLRSQCHRFKPKKVSGQDTQEGGLRPLLLSFPKPQTTRPSSLVSLHLGYPPSCPAAQPH